MDNSEVIDPSAVIELEIAPARLKKSPLDVEGVDVGLSAEEIVSMLRESRERDRP